MRGVWVVVLVGASWLGGQTEHKDKATDYPAHMVAGGTSIGAEYLVHSIPAGNQTFVAQDYLVVEVAVFPARGESVHIGGDTFTLRINGKKFAVTPDSPGMVAASIQYPDWEQRPTAVASAGAGNAGVILGQPPAVARFPGDPTANRVPSVPRVPDIDEQNGVERDKPETAETVIAKSALPEGPAAKPVSGFLFFRYKGKLKSIKSVELIYQANGGSAALKLL
jgi:hypothetical protein